jgi:hypothetical protein
LVENPTYFSFVSLLQPFQYWGDVAYSDGPLCIAYDRPIERVTVRERESWKDEGKGDGNNPVNHQFFLSEYDSRLRHYGDQACARL